MSASPSLQIIPPIVVPEGDPVAEFFARLRLVDEDIKAKVPSHCICATCVVEKANGINALLSITAEWFASVQRSAPESARDSYMPTIVKRLWQAVVDGVRDADPAMWPRENRFPPQLLLYWCVLDLLMKEYEGNPITLILVFERNAPRLTRLVQRYYHIWNFIADEAVPCSCEEVCEYKNHNDCFEKRLRTELMNSVDQFESIGFPSSSDLGFSLGAIPQCAYFPCTAARWVDSPSLNTTNPGHRVEPDRKDFYARWIDPVETSDPNRLLRGCPGCSRALYCSVKHFTEACAVHKFVCRIRAAEGDLFSNVKYRLQPPKRSCP